jgi:hypothetical protein
MALTKIHNRMISGASANVQDFGAVGDGVTDDKPAIQLAIDSLIDGGVLYIPSTASYYRINATSLSEAITVNKQITVVLDGELRGTTFVNQASPPFIMNVTADNVVIKGKGTFKGDGTVIQTGSNNTYITGLLRIDASNVIIDGLNFIQSPQAAIFANSGSNNVTVTNSIFKGYATTIVGGTNYYQVFFNVTSYGAIVSHNRFLEYDATHMAIQCISFSGGEHDHALITENYCRAALDQFTYANVINSVVSNNIAVDGIAASSLDGIKLNGGFKNAVIGNSIDAEGGLQLLNQRDITVVGNKINFSEGRAIYLYDNASSSDKNMNNIVVSSNVIVGEGTAATGDVLSGITYIPVLASSNVIIEGNVLHNCGKDRDTEAAIRCQGTTGAVTNLTIRDNQITGDFNQYAISVVDCDNVDLSDNKAIISGGTPSQYRPIYANNCDYIRINGNYIKNENTGTVEMDVAIYVPSANYIINTNNVVLNWLRAGPGNYPWPSSASDGSTNHGNQLSTQSLNGTFTLDAANTKVIANTNMFGTSTTNGDCTVELTPLNASAAALMGSSKTLYVSAIVEYASFTVATADASAAAGTEIFAYKVIE